jgi:hypothetical protein
MEGNLRIAADAVTAKPAYRHHRAKLFVFKASALVHWAVTYFKNFY